jgi:large subunit GTPase 1
MPKQGGQGKGKPKQGDRNFGSALIKSQRNRVPEKDKRILSILDNSSLDDYILTSEMEGQDATVIKANHPILVENVTSKPIQSIYLGQYEHRHLSIPRRPKWTTSMSAEDLELQETESFLQWRRYLAQSESTSQNLKITPFEKNLDVWRQLWRVIEKSDILLQIVDARNPLFY